MAIYVVTNRKVTGNKINTDGRERAQPVFRVATYNLVNKRYELLPDDFLDSAQKALNATPPAPGSANMFRALHRDMSSESENCADVLFYIHGFNVSLEDSWQDIQKLHELYVKPPETPVRHLVYLSWPAIGKIDEYRDDQRDAVATGQVVGRLFRTICEYLRVAIGNDSSKRCRQRIHLMTHSMGAQVLEHAIQSIASDLSSVAPIVNEAILVNSDVNWHALEQGKPLHLLPEICQRIHIYIHQGDGALLTSEWTKNGYKRLGRNGPRDLRQICSHTTIVDTSNTPANPGTGHAERSIDHWGFKTRDVVIQDIQAVLRGEATSRISRRSSVQPNYFDLL